MHGLLTPVNGRTSMNDGTLHEKSDPVLEMPFQTASGVGMVGGEAGLNAATTNPLIGYVGVTES